MTVRIIPDHIRPELPPNDLHPTVLFGFVWGGKLRWEKQNPQAEKIVDSKWFLRDVKPDGEYSVSNLQKQSFMGFLLFKPFLFRCWFMPKKQLHCAHGGHVPNSELGIDVRSPGFRKDYAGHKGNFWDWTNGRIGFHFD